MKQLSLFYFVLLLAGLSQAQTITVVKKNSSIKGNNAMGQSLELAGNADNAESLLTKFLKDYGKTRSISDYISITNPFMGGITYEGKVLYATTGGDEKKAQIWIGLDTAEWRGEDVNRVLDKVNKLLYQFGVRFYREQIQKDIDEAQQAFDATEKQKVRLTNQNKDLNTRLGSNEQEKIRLEKALEANKLEKAVLLQKIVNNKKSQDSVASAGVQIKKVLDAQIEKQKKVN
jgi:hypothetical protein